VKKRIYCAMAALAIGATLMTGCATKCAKRSTEWVMATENPEVLDRNHAPDWVRGLTPQSERSIYFVGRSDDSIACLSERDAIQSARTDIHDQIRQRLAPRNVGEIGQTASMAVDSGTCNDCRRPLPATETVVETPCNSPCLHSSVAGPGDCVSRSHCGSCATTALDRGQQVDVISKCDSCSGTHAFIATRRANCASCPTLVHAVSADHRPPDYLPHDARIARDINVFNVGIDSVMPALLSQLQEETVYFENVRLVAEVNRSGRNSNASAVATGVKGHRAWLLCSIPRAEFSGIATEFRGRYEELYDMTLEWTVEDRQRRVEWETNDRRTELEWKEEERAWNREDEIVTRDHTITLDKDRHPMPGRRFGVVGSQ